ncbi:hypothetical protein HYW42_01555 [Candidatus Daviesbacteria bacterium]|nr:hypothetical protein [Candidatus Daviesbacteria bacterium]
MQKGQTAVLVVLGILILGIVAGGAYYFGKSQVAKPQQQNAVITSQTSQLTPASSPSPVDETANWKAYKDSKYAYSFKYPNTWYLVSVEGDQKLYNVPPETAGPAYEISFFVAPISRGINLSDRIGAGKEVADKVFEEKTGDYNLGNVSGAKIKTEVLSGSQTDAVPTIGVKIALNTLEVLYVEMICTESNCTTIDELFDQILSSLRLK